jgi:hypothetical protein
VKEQSENPRTQFEKVLTTITGFMDFVCRLIFNRTTELPVRKSYLNHWTFEVCQLFNLCLIYETAVVSHTGRMSLLLNPYLCVGVGVNVIVSRSTVSPLLPLQSTAPNIRSRFVQAVDRSNLGANVTGRIRGSWHTAICSDEMSEQSLSGRL